MKAVTNNVYRSIGLDSVLMIRWAISAISFPGSSVSLIFLQGLYKRTNVRIVDLLLILDDGSEDLRTVGVVPKVFFDILPDIKRDGCEHRISDPSNIAEVKVS